MKTIDVPIKQLRVDPHAYVRLLQDGYRVNIIEHRRVIATASTPPSLRRPQPGNGAEVLRVIKSLPKIKTPYPDVPTVELIKQTRLSGFEADAAKRQRVRQ